MRSRHSGCNVKGIKKRLYRFRDTEREINSLWERIEYLEQKMITVSSPEFSGMPKVNDPEGDKIGRLVAKKIDLERKAGELEASQKQEQEAIRKVLALVKDARKRQLIEMRYFDDAKWTDIAAMFFGTESDYEEKEDSYVRKMHKWHGDALEKMAALMRDQ